MKNLLSYEEWILSNGNLVSSEFLLEKKKSSQKTEEVSERHIQHFLEDFTKL